MSTFVHDSLISLDERWSEVDTLLDAAKQYIVNEKLHHALCRSAVVLIVAHLEGFIKDAAKCIIMDINRHSSFRSSTKHIKKTFCSLFASQDHCIKELIDIFDGLDVKIRVDPFISGNSDNPSPTVIERVASKFGLKSFFKKLIGSELEDAFSGTFSEVDALSRRLKDHVIQWVEAYPYNVDSSVFRVSAIDKVSFNGRTLWEEFIDDLLKIRNGIAHGASLSNALSIEDILERKMKVFILQFSFLLLLCERVTPRLSVTMSP